MGSKGPKILSSDRRLPQLDGLRGIAILLVLSLHTLGGTSGRSVLDNAINIGWIGVDLFFVLSGFLITGILLEAKGRDGYFRNFYLRRALRIWPLYYLVVLFAFAVVPLLDRSLQFRSSWSLTAQYIFFVQNLVPPIQFGPWPLQVSWSLAIEEQFYILWPLLVWTLDDRALIRMLIGIVLLAPILRLGMMLGGAPPLPVYIVTPFRIDTLASGGLVALALRASRQGGENGLSRVYRRGLWLLPVGIIAVVFGLEGDRLAVSTTPPGTAEALILTTTFSLLALGFSGLLMFAVERPSSPFVSLLSIRPLRYVGMISFGLYLYHGLLIPLFNTYIRPAVSSIAAPPAAVWAANQIVFCILLFGLAHTSWRFLEQPILRLKYRFA